MQTGIRGTSGHISNVISDAKGFVNDDDRTLRCFGRRCLVDGKRSITTDQGASAGAKHRGGGCAHNVLRDLSGAGLYKGS